jgi:hypothetical protein
MVSILDQILTFKWLEVIGLTLMCIGLVLAKKDLVANMPDYGTTIYYVLIILFLAAIYFFWYT